MTATPIIVTRAMPGATDTAKRLKTLGYHPIVSPVLQLEEKLDAAVPDMDAISGLVFTSANAVRFFTERENTREQTAWCVGPATAAAAREAGFHDVAESAGNAADLARFILANSESTERPLLHIANAAAKGTLKSRLEAEGRKVVFCPLYKAVPVSKLSDSVIQLLESKHEAALLVHSEKGAKAFLEIASNHPRSHLTGIAISPTVGELLKQAGLEKIHIAQAPNETELLKAMQTAFDEM